MDYIRVNTPEPHVQRGRDIIKAHPEIKSLLGPTPFTAIFVVLIVAAQIGLAAWIQNSPWWAVLLLAYGVGAFACHALWVLIHDCTHNLVFKSANANKLLQIAANLPHMLPSAMSFRNYHLRHHAHQGNQKLDADLASEFEAKFAGRSTVRKALWLLFYFIFQSLRASRLKTIPFFDRWIIGNVIISVAFNVSIVYFFGWAAWSFLFLSSIFSIGLHPLGARWIQEHFVVHPGQETFSYYGPLNVLAFNVGYHNEHHDFMKVPWSRLPQVRAMAPEFYNNLYYHKSWTKLFFRFLFDSKITLYSRAVR